MLLGTRSMDNSVKLTLAKDQKSFVQCSKMAKQTLFEKQMILLKTLLWSRKLQFWQPCRSNPKRDRVVFAQGRKMIQKFFCRKKRHLKKFQWTCNTHFWRPYRKKLDRKSKTFRSMSGNDEEDIFRRKTNSRIFRIDTKKAVLKTLPKNYLPESCKSLNVQIWWKTFCP